MREHDFRTIPVIDIEGLFAGDAARDMSIVESLGRAARDVGFLYLRGHGIEPARFDGLLAAARRFFALPLDEKMRVYIGRSRNHRGYVPLGEEQFYGGGEDAKEAYDLALDLPGSDPDYLAGNPMLGPNQWPQLDGFREAVGAYYEGAIGLGRRLLRAFALALGEPADAFDGYVSKPPSQLRLVHYPCDPRAQGAQGIGAHTDYECFTLLHTTAPGLEVLNGRGEWIDAPPLPGAFVVNIGDMLELWTNGEFVATSHRVRKVTEERYSFPLFFSVDYDTRVAPLPQFVGESRPALHAPVIAGEHLFAQTAQSFRYLQERRARGEIRLPDDARPLASFGRRKV